ncbi:TPA: DUF2931 family protein [Aeromonas veronii]|nr:DUF2931 family protein [Aeromonas veronii]
MRRWLLLLLLGLAGCSDNGPAKMSWEYCIGSNADEIWHTRALFSGKNSSSNELTHGVMTFVDKERLKKKDYRWQVGKCLSFDNQPVPDKVEIDWVSYHDMKRYSITLELPRDLGKQMTRPYRFKEDGIAQRNVIMLGLAPGGYVEVFFIRPARPPDILLASGIARIVADCWDHNKTHLDRHNGINGSIDRFGAFYEKYPIPTGVEWASIMEVYRAAKPTTDINSVN